jgi:hypothetical protein
MCPNGRFNRCQQPGSTLLFSLCLVVNNACPFLCRVSKQLQDGLISSGRAIRLSTNHQLSVRHLDYTSRLLLSSKIRSRHGGSIVIRTVTCHLSIPSTCFAPLSGWQAQLTCAAFAQLRPQSKSSWSLLCMPRVAGSERARLCQCTSDRVAFTPDVLCSRPKHAVPPSSGQPRRYRVRAAEDATAFPSSVTGYRRSSPAHLRNLVQFLRLRPVSLLVWNNPW